MGHNPLFNIARAEATPPGSLASRAAPAAAASAVGVIPAQQSAITFAGAPAAVTVVWKVLGLAIPAGATAKGFPIPLSLAVGVLIYLQSATFTNRKGKGLGVVFPFINFFALPASTPRINAAVHLRA